MYAVIQNGPHQYRVTPGQFLRVQKLPLSPGKVWKCSQVLAFQDKAGQLMAGAPYLQKAQAYCRVVRHGKDKKQIVFKKNRRKGYRKTQGHRQEFTEIYVEQIHSPGGEQIKAPAKKTVSANRSVKKSSPVKPSTAKSPGEKPSTAQTSLGKPS